MKILIAGAAVLLAASASPALANGGAGRGGGGHYGHAHGAAGSSFGNLAWLMKVSRISGAFDPPGFSSRGRHDGWFRGRHWGWFKQHNPHWPHHPPVSP